MEASGIDTDYAFVWTCSINMSFPRVSADSVMGGSTGVITGIAVVVLGGTTSGMITGQITVFGGEISGENTLPLLVILLVPAILTMSESSFSAILSSMSSMSGFTPW